MVEQGRNYFRPCFLCHASNPYDVGIRNKTKSVILIIAGVIMNRELMFYKLEASSRPLQSGKIKKDIKKAGAQLPANINRKQPISRCIIS